MFLPKSLRRVLKACLTSDYALEEDKVRWLKNNGIRVTDTCCVSGFCPDFVRESERIPVLHALEVGDYSRVKLGLSVFNGFIKVGDFSKVNYEYGSGCLLGPGPVFAISGKQCCDIQINMEGKQSPGYEWAQGFAVKGDSFQFRFYLNYSRHYWSYLLGAWYISMSGEAAVGSLQLYYAGKLLCEIPPNKSFNFSGTSLEAIKKDIRKWQRERKKTEASRGTEPRSVCA